MCLANASLRSKVSYTTQQHRNCIQFHLVIISIQCTICCFFAVITLCAYSLCQYNVVVYEYLRHTEYSRVLNRCRQASIRGGPAAKPVDYYYVDDRPTNATLSISIPDTTADFISIVSLLLMWMAVAGTVCTGHNVMWCMRFHLAWMRDPDHDGRTTTSTANHRQMSNWVKEKLSISKCKTGIPVAFLIGKQYPASP